MASILIKLVMDMWLEMPAHESLPLVLDMLQATLEGGDVACRTRVFDLVYNLSLHAHVMVPLDANDVERTNPRSPDLPGKHVLYGTSDTPAHVRSRALCSCLLA